jgi:ADP-ribose pyrophosphatase YjhB (NUDIX family)
MQCKKSAFIVHSLSSIVCTHINNMHTIFDNMTDDVTVGAEDSATVLIYINSEQVSWLYVGCFFSEWGTPGGQIDCRACGRWVRECKCSKSKKKWEIPWKACVREFKEETGRELMPIRNKCIGERVKFTRKCTRFYVLHFPYNHAYMLYLGDPNNHECNWLAFVRISCVLKRVVDGEKLKVNGRKHHIRPCFVELLRFAAYQSAAATPRAWTYRLATIVIILLVCLWVKRYRFLHVISQYPLAFV